VPSGADAARTMPQLIRDDIPTVNSTELAKLLDMSPRQIYVLAERKLVVRSGRGFDHEASLKRYIGHLRRAVEIRKMIPDAPDATVQKLADFLTAEILKQAEG
jgi:phage terminase Nu1 subunit (DNA packaging protein)